MTEITSGDELAAYYHGIFEANKKQWFDFEAIIQAVYEALLRAGDVAIDGGAHMGVHSVPMARKVGPGGKVFAFEPVHEIVRAFRQRIETECPELKPIIQLHELAISDHSGVAEFLVLEDPGYSGLRERLYPREMQTDRRKVLVDTLDHVCGAVSPVRFIKLDLEGGEFDALRGAAGILRRERPAVVFEYDRFNTPRFYHYEHDDLLRFFEDLDYRILDVIGTPFDAPPMWDAATLWYYFGLPREADLFDTVQGAIQQSIRAQAPGCAVPDVV